MTSLMEKRIVNILLTEVSILTEPKNSKLMQKNYIRKELKINDSDQGQNTGIRQK
jgi:hypothetical protein